MLMMERKLGGKGLKEERNSFQVTPSVTSQTLVLEFLGSVFSLLLYLQCPFFVTYSPSWINLSIRYPNGHHLHSVTAQKNLAKALSYLSPKP